MDLLLTVAFLASMAAYFVFFGAGFWAEHRGKTLAALRKACQHYWTAVALSALSLVIRFAEVSFSGWLRLIAPASTVVCCTAVAVLTGHKRDRKVIQEMQRDLGRES